MIAQISDVDLHLVFASLGVVNPSGTTPAPSDTQIDRITMTALLRPMGLNAAELTAEGAVGDISYCLFNADGEEQPRDAHRKKLPKEYWRFFLTAGHYSQRSGVEFYRQMVEAKRTVVVIAGPYKEVAIRAALKGKLFNVWFTEEETARNILSMP